MNPDTIKACIDARSMAAQNAITRNTVDRLDILFTEVGQQVMFEPFDVAEQMIREALTKIGEDKVHIETKQNTLLVAVWPRALQPADGGSTGYVWHIGRTIGQLNNLGR
jgi:uncharacterized SAM-dependent methyltransferase